MTKREHQSLNYDVLRDRRRPPALSCSVVAALGAGSLIALVLLGFFVSNAMAHSGAPIPTRAVLPSPTVHPTNTRTPAPTDTASPDAWGMTGTALAHMTASPTPTASPTLDYCWWETPSPTPSPTWPYTPDSWGATGTAIYQADHPYQTPTLQPPRELCGDVPTWTATPATTENVTQQVTPGDTMTLETLPVIQAPDTWTPQPTSRFAVQQVQAAA